MDTNGGEKTLKMSFFHLWILKIIIYKVWIICFTQHPFKSKIFLSPPQKKMFNIRNQLKAFGWDILDHLLFLCKLVLEIVLF